MIKIIKAIFDQVTEILSDGDKENPTLQKTKIIMGGLLKGAIKMSATMAGAGAIADGGIKAFDSMNSKSDEDLTVNDLRDALGTAIKEFIDSKKKEQQQY